MLNEQPEPLFNDFELKSARLRCAFFFGISEELKKNCLSLIDGGQKSLEGNPQGT